MAIISHIQGGLGNQMFQYGIGIALSKRYQTNLQLDCSWFETTPPGSTPRQFELPLLQISDEVLINPNRSFQAPKLNKFLKRILPSFGSHILKEKNGYRFDDRLLKLQYHLHRNIHLIGYWQSFKYIEEIRPELQLAFQTKSPPSNRYQEYLDRIKTSNSTMIHIRRGDYVHLHSANLFHQALNDSYYLRGIEEIRHLVPETNFFVFSDDLDWAKNTLPSNLPITFIEHSDTKDAAAQELQLMTNCNNHIIANSSLSWWGAWLKKEKQGHVFAPNRWIRDQSLNLDDLIPQDWERLVAE